MTATIIITTLLVITFKPLLNFTKANIYKQRPKDQKLIVKRKWTIIFLWFIWFIFINVPIDHILKLLGIPI